MEKKVYVKEDIVEILNRNDKAVLRAVVNIFMLQTEDEKSTDATKIQNGVGFSGADAEIMSSFAKQILKNGSLSPKQMGIAKKKIVRYAKQLTRIANGELTVPSFIIPESKYFSGNSTNKVPKVENKRLWEYKKNGERSYRFRADNIRAASDLVEEWNKEMWYGCSIQEIDEKTGTFKVGGDFTCIPVKSYYDDILEDIKAKNDFAQYEMEMEERAFSRKFDDELNGF